MNTLQEIPPTLLPNRGVIQLSGADRATFLQGLITNDIHRLEDQPVIYTALLTPQGRFLFDLFIYRQEDTFLIECQGDRLPELLKKLSLYKLRSDILLEDVSAQYHVVVSGTKDGISHPLLPDPRIPDLGWRGLVPTNFQPLPASDDDPYNDLRISLGVPDGARDLIPEKSIPLENGLDELHAIDWQKGCYMGQELTARTRYRGLVRKRLLPCVIEGPAPAFGEKIQADGDDVGEMRTCQGNRGLALIRLEAFQAFLKTGIPFTAGKTRLFPYSSDWMEILFPEESTKSEKLPGSN